MWIGETTLLVQQRQDVGYALCVSMLFFSSGGTTFKSTPQSKRKNNRKFIESYAAHSAGKWQYDVKQQKFHYIQFYKWIFNQNCLFSLSSCFVFSFCFSFVYQVYVRCVCMVLLLLFFFLSRVYVSLLALPHFFWFTFFFLHSFYLARISILLRVFAAYCDTISVKR